MQDSRKAKKPVRSNDDKCSDARSPEYKGYAKVKLKHEKAVRHSASEMETREDLLKRLLDPELTLGETAKILNVCKMTVRRYTNRGILPSIRTAGNQRRFKLSAVLDFIEKYGKNE